MCNFMAEMPVNTGIQQLYKQEMRLILSVLQVRRKYSVIPLFSIVIFLLEGISLEAMPLVPVISRSDTVSCSPQDSITLTVTNPDTIDILPQSVGPTNLSIGQFDLFFGLGQFANFTVASSFAKIKTIDVFFGGLNGAGYTLIIRNAASLQTVFTISGVITISSSSIPQVLNLNVTLTQGNYQIGFTSNPGTYRNKDGSAYPYSTASNGIRITGNTFDSLYYYYFYNWKVDVPVAAPVTYSWMPGNLSGKSIKVSPAATTVYTVTSTKPDNSTATATAKVWYLPLAAPMIQVNGPTTVCPGTSLILDAGPGYASYIWRVGTVIVGNSRMLSVAPTTSTTYAVEVGDGGPCKSVSVQTIIIQVPNVPVISPGDTAFCQGSIVTLDAGSGYASYLWKRNSVVLGNGRYQSAGIQGLYQVVVSDALGCTASNSVNITVHENPPVATLLTKGDVSLCDNGYNSPLVLAADTAGTGPMSNVVWNDIFSTPSNVLPVNWNDINLQLSGNTYDFNFTVINSFGCFKHSNNVTVNTVTCNLVLNLKLFLEGYYLGSGMMQTTLINQFVPGATFSQTDSIHVELRDAENPTHIMGIRWAMLMTDGHASCQFDLPPDEYWIVIKHRNSVQTWSAMPIMLPVALYDFSTSDMKAYGNNMTQPLGDGVWTLFMGDLNQDEYVDIFDFPILDYDNTNFVQSTYSTADLNGDSFVDIFDFPYYDVNNINFVFSLHP